MTWAEFRIRSYAYDRMQKTQMYKLRELAWASTIGPHLDPKKLPKTKEIFMPLELEQKRRKDKAKADAFLKARLKYEQIKKEKANG